MNVEFEYETGMTNRRRDCYAVRRVCSCNMKQLTMTMERRESERERRKGEEKDW